MNAHTHKHVIWACKLLISICPEDGLDVLGKVALVELWTDRG